ncbi:MAG: NAD(P)H-hydrate epimerase, partial [Actinomycetota bacterium]
MKPILSPAEAAALEAAPSARGVEPAALMERAGDAVARAALALAGGRYGRRVVVACGTGNNGGDGYVAARLLRAWGCAVEVVAVGGAPAPGMRREPPTTTTTPEDRLCAPRARRLDEAEVARDEIRREDPGHLDRATPGAEQSGRDVAVAAVVPGP